MEFLHFVSFFSIGGVYFLVLSLSSPSLEHETHSFQGFARGEASYRHDAEPSERRASPSTQVLVCTAAYEIPLAEVVAAVKQHAHMAACWSLVAEKASDEHPLHRLGDVAIS